MVDVTVTDPSTIAENPILTDGDTLLMVDGAGKVKRVSKSTVENKPLGLYEGARSLGNVTLSTYDLTGLGAANLFDRVNDNEYTYSGNIAASFASGYVKQSGPRTGKQYYIHHVPTGPALAFTSVTTTDPANATELFTGASAYAASVNYSGAELGNGGFAPGDTTLTADFQRTPFVIVVDWDTDEVKLRYLDTSDDIQEVTVSDDVIPEGDIFIYSTLAQGVPSGNAICGVDPIYLADQNLIPSDATPLQMEAGYLMPEGYVAGDLLLSDVTIALESGFFILKGDMFTFADDGEGGYTAVAFINRTAAGIPLYESVTINVPEDANNIKVAMEMASEFVLPDEFKNPTTVFDYVTMPRVTISVAAGTTLVANENAFSFSQDLYDHIRVTTRGEVFVDMTDADNRYLFGGCPGVLSGKWTCSALPSDSGDAMLTHVINNNSLGTIIGGGLGIDGFLELRGFNKGSIINQSNAVMLYLDEKLTAVPSTTTDYTTVTGYAEPRFDYVLGQVNVRDTINIKDYKLDQGDDIEFIICAYNETDEVYLNMDNVPNRTNVRHYSGYLHFSSFNETNVHLLDWNTNRSDTPDYSPISKTPFRFLTFSGSTGLTFDTSYIDGPHWVGGGFDGLIELNMLDYDEDKRWGVKISGICIPDAADFNTIIDFYSSVAPPAQNVVLDINFGDSDIADADALTDSQVCNTVMPIDIPNRSGVGVFVKNRNPVLHTDGLTEAERGFGRYNQNVTSVSMNSWSSINSWGWYDGMEARFVGGVSTIGPVPAVTLGSSGGVTLVGQGDSYIKVFDS